MVNLIVRRFRDDDDAPPLGGEANDANAPANSGGGEDANENGVNTESE